MRLSRGMRCGSASVLLFSGILWLNPLIAGPWTQIEGPVFDPFDFRACVDVCRSAAEFCLDDCQMGGYPPEFNPAGCLYHCNQVRVDCMEEACRGWLPPEF